MSSVLLVTSSDLPAGEPGGHLLVEAFAALGVDARWVCWDDPDVDWAAADLVAVRSTWDYDGRLPEFLAWARSVGPSLVNGVALFAWNTDKSYLVTLGSSGLPVVPTLVAEGQEGLATAIASYDIAVVKPRVGADGRGVVVLDGTDGGPADLDEATLGPGPWVVQPLVESVRTDGEHSVFVLGGEAVAQVRKVPSGNEIRVHEAYGGSTVAVALDPEAAALARRAVEVAERVAGGTLVYARVDLLRMPDGALVVSELEVTEPGLYLDVLPANADAFADAVVALLPDPAPR
jgi:glutathione synthase/RimK-type ligase-like ATP-grasp enzyme